MKHIPKTEIRRCKDCRTQWASNWTYIRRAGKPTLYRCGECQSKHDRKEPIADLCMYCEQWPAVEKGLCRACAEERTYPNF